MKKTVQILAMLFTCSAMAQPVAVQIGNNPNAFSCAEKSRSNIWYDEDINTVLFIHKSDTAVTHDAGTGFYRYDISTNGGNTWSINQGPIYSNLNDKKGGFPLCASANYPFNTVPANANIAYAGAWKNNTSSRSGSVYGIGYLNGGGYIQHYDSLSYAFYPENIFRVRFTGDLWMVGSMFTNDSDNYYLDSIVVAHGIWNGITLDYDFTYQHLYVPVNPDVGEIVDIDIAFDDFGTVGYIAMITNRYTLYSDSTLYMEVLMSNNGGTNWNITGNLYQAIYFYHALDSLLANDTSLNYGTTNDLDVVVDQNANLHILTGVAPSVNYQVACDDVPGKWGMFDIFTEDYGVTWKAQLLGKPQTFRGTFGNGSAANPLMDEDNRPFASRSPNGDRLFFSWFDTDTLAYGTDPNSPRHNNRNPDLYTIGYNVNTNLWTDVMNLTQGTNADGLCTFGNGSYHVIDSALTGTVFSIPVVYQELQFQDPVQTGSPATFWYLKNANIDMSTATHPGNPVSLPSNFGISVKENNTSGLLISPNYPNPFTGKTSVDLNLKRTADVTIEVSNILGEVLSVNKYPNLNSGFHTLSIDGGRLSSGIYIYKVKAGNHAKAGKMIVQ